ncbi:MAG: bifunctional pyr operon transcriptional regulator/uracil phosphoribosyltransferase PyrR [Gammaproteobacteria bacterium]
MNLDSGEIGSLLERMAQGLTEALAGGGRVDPLVVGIHTGGVWIAQRLRERLGLPDPLGSLNIAFYRDDFSRLGMHPSVKPSNLPFDIDERHVILVDDILYTGRTVRAALNEIFDYGRPASVTLAVLVDRCQRELPIRADVVGTTLALAPGEHIKLSGPDPLRLITHKAA